MTQEQKTGLDGDKARLRELMERIGKTDATALTPQEQAWLEDFRRRYPFFALTADEPTELCAPESHARLDGDEETLHHDGFYPPQEQPATPTTLAAIDDFLNTYGHQSAEEDALLERLIFNPIPDYAQQLAAQESQDLPSTPAADANSQQARIDRFILSQKAPQDAKPEQPSAPAESAEQPSASVDRPRSSSSKSKPAVPEQPKTEKPGLLSESLAKIYIKTRRYERAYEILNDLSLRFPEKSRYFADQLRFLRKLIHNEQQLRAQKAEESQ